MRQIARDCKAPGRYTIELHISHRRGRPRIANIHRVEPIRILKEP
jgi:hypothetical protein